MMAIKRTVKKALLGLLALAVPVWYVNIVLRASEYFMFLSIWVKTPDRINTNNIAQNKIINTAVKIGWRLLTIVHALLIFCIIFRIYSSTKQSDGFYQVSTGPLRP